MHHTSCLCLMSQSLAGLHRKVHLILPIHPLNTCPGTRANLGICQISGVGNLFAQSNRAFPRGQLFLQTCKFTVVRSWKFKQPLVTPYLWPHQCFGERHSQHCSGLKPSPALQTMLILWDLQTVHRMARYRGVSLNELDWLLLADVRPESATGYTLCTPSFTCRGA